MGAKYIHNVATSIMRQAKLVCDNRQWTAAEAYRDFSLHLIPVLWRMSPETLGRIAACGTGAWDRPEGGAKRRTPLAYARSSSTSDLTWQLSGKALLVEIACTAVICEITDILNKRLEKSLETRKATE